MSETTTDTDLRMVLYDAVTAYGDACDELADAFHDREGVDRDLVVTLEDEAGRAREAIDRAVEALIAEAEARGRATGLAEVDAAIEMFVGHLGIGTSVHPTALTVPCGWESRGIPGPTPTAAILAAAASFAAALHDEAAR